MDFPQYSPSYNVYAPVYSLHGEQPLHGEQLVQLLPTVSVKVFNPTKKSDVKLFVLRNVSVSCLDSMEKVRGLLGQQLVDVISKDPNFEFGYIQGNQRVWVKSEEDVKEVQRLLSSKEKSGVTLWCMGKSEARGTKRHSTNENDSDVDEPDGDVRSKPKKSKKSRHEEKLE